VRFRNGNCLQIGRDLRRKLLFAFPEFRFFLPLKPPLSVYTADIDFIESEIGEITSLNIKGETSKISKTRGFAELNKTIVGLGGLFGNRKGC
jgi:hypothetical protein